MVKQPPCRSVRQTAVTTRMGWKCAVPQRLSRRGVGRTPLRLSSAEDGREGEICPAPGRFCRFGRMGESWSVLPRNAGGEVERSRDRETDERGHGADRDGQPADESKRAPHHRTTFTLSNCTLPGSMVSASQVPAFSSTRVSVRSNASGAPADSFPHCCVFRSNRTNPSSTKIR